MNKIVVLGHNARSKQFNELKRAASRLGVELDLCSYDQMHFDTATKEMSLNGKQVNSYDVYFFRNSKGCWEEVNLVANHLDNSKIIVDKVMQHASPSEICKAHQMDVLSNAGIEVPKTVYGSLSYLSSEAVRQFTYPLIIKGSKGDRVEQVFKVIGPRAFAEKIAELKPVEDAGENKYMLQEYIRHSVNYRVLVVGDKVLGVMSREFGDNPRIRNEFNSCDLPDSAKQVAVNASKICGISVAGVDMVFKDSRPLIFEVNKTPSYDRFVEVTGIDVASEIVKFLANLRNNDTVRETPAIVVPAPVAVVTQQPFVADRSFPAFSTTEAAPVHTSRLSSFLNSPSDDTITLRSESNTIGVIEAVLNNSNFKRIIIEKD